MTPPDSQLPALARLLVRGGSAEPLLADPAITQLARRNLVLIRLADVLERDGSRGGPDDLRAAADRERLRVARTIELIARVSDTLTRAGIAHVFPKALQHYPDMGHDIDVLVDGRGDAADRALLEGLDASRTVPGVFDRISGKTGLMGGDWPSPVEVHHGRLGQAGEQTALAAGVLARRRFVAAAGGSMPVPALEDDVLVHAYQRVCCHLSMRISDVMKGAALDGDARLDRRLVADRAREYGLTTALRVYLRYVTAFTGDVDAGLPTRNGQYRVAIGDAASAYAEEAGTLMARAEWDGLRRLALTPFAFTVSRSQAAWHALRQAHL